VPGQWPFCAYSACCSLGTLWGRLAAIILDASFSQVEKSEWWYIIKPLRKPPAFVGAFLCRYIGHIQTAKNPPWRRAFRLVRSSHPCCTVFIYSPVGQQKSRETLSVGLNIPGGAEGGGLVPLCYMCIAGVKPCSTFREHRFYCKVKWCLSWRVRGYICSISIFGKTLLLGFLLSSLQRYFATWLISFYWWLGGCKEKRLPSLGTFLLICMMRKNLASLI